MKTLFAPQSQLSHQMVVLKLWPAPIPIVRTLTMIYTPTSNTPNPLPQLAHTPLSDLQKNSFCTTKSTVPSNSIADVLTPTHPNIPCPTHTSDSPKAPETTTFPSYHNVTNKTELVHGTWRRIGPPHDNMNASISSEIVLGPKRKQQEAPSPDDSHNDKK